MSDLDEETKRLLAEVEASAQLGSNDSKKKPKEDKTKTDDGNDWETNEEDSPDSEW